MAILLRERPVLTGLVVSSPHSSTGKPGFDATVSIFVAQSAIMTKIGQFEL
jgi:hypothetical protein